MQSVNLQSQIKHFPKKPGCYLFKDSAGTVLYVGKAKNIKARTSQYFGLDKRPQLPFLIKEAASIDYIVSANELESLYLENNLIKKYQPRYNIKLKDDKNYAYIAINYQTPISQIGYVRSVAGSASQNFTNLTASWSTSPTNKVKGKLSHVKSSYYGPYSSIKKVKVILETTRRIFPYCGNSQLSNRPCFYYHLHRCPGVCVGKITLDEYQSTIRKIQLFLSGQFQTVKKELAKQMKQSADKKRFEQAARLRDQLRALESLEQKQSVQFTKPFSYDFVATATSGFVFAVNLLKVRDGKLIDQETFFYQSVAPAQPTNPASKQTTSPTKRNHAANSAVSINHGRDLYEQMLITRFCENYYQETSDLPDKIFLENQVNSPDLLKKLLATRSAKTISLAVPQRGKARKLLSLSKLNAQDQLRKNLDSSAEDLDKIKKALETLQNVLHLQSLPRRIECFDISNIQGTNAVASMVVFTDGKPAKSEYRKFKIRIQPANGGPDDFAMMHETISRRLRHLSNDLLRINDQGSRMDHSWPHPDLIVVDGGKGQLNAALKAQRELQIPINKLQTIPKSQTDSKGLVRDQGFPPKPNPPLAEKIKDAIIPMIGLAKRIEEIFLPGKKEPIVLSHDNPALQLLQRLRDEAHRFAITFHKAKRSKAATRSALEEIPGIGPKTKKLLKLKFGTVADIKKASPDELAKVVGQAKADLLKDQL